MFSSFISIFSNALTVKLYTGITSNLERRLLESNWVQETAYTFNRRPVKLVFQESIGDLSSTLRKKAHQKKWSANKMGVD
jgi:putative endonuclease